MANEILWRLLRPYGEEMYLVLEMLPSFFYKNKFNCTVRNQGNFVGFRQEKTVGDRGDSRQPLDLLAKTGLRIFRW